MKAKLTGKEINQFATERNDLPDYFGYRIFPFNEYTKNGDCKKKIVNGEFIAKRYKDILSVIEETKARVKINKYSILIEYNNGEIKITRDLLTDTFLIPLLTN